jgi:hypothetical protein
VVNERDTIKYNTENTDTGMPAHLFVYDILWDTSGNTWIATDGGVAIYNGYTWSNITTDDGLPAIDCQDLAFDITTNTVWIGIVNGGVVGVTDTGLAIYNTTNSALTTNVVRSIEVDAEGNLWVGTAFGAMGIHILHDTGWSVHMPLQSISSIMFDDTGTAWLGSSKGLHRFNDTLQATYTNSHGLPDKRIESAAIDRKGNILVATKKGFGIFNPNGICFNTRFDIDHICAGDSVGSIVASADWGTPPYSYSWSPGGQTTPVLSNLGASTHVLTVTDSSGWQTIDTVTLHQGTPLVLDTILYQPTFADTNGAIQALGTGGTPPYQYRWSNGHRLGLMKYLPGGKYKINVIDAAGCEDSLTFVFSSGLADPARNRELNVWPNPAHPGTYISWELANAEITLKDLMGRTIVRRSHANKLRIPAHVSPGLYVVHFEKDRQFYAAKLMITR